MKTLSLVLALVAVVACAESPTGVPTRHALKDCAEVLAVDCGIAPSIDSISPTSAAPAQMDMNGHLVAPAMATFVCVYGKHLDGASVFFNAEYQASDATGCGNLVFTAPVTASGQIPVYVVTEYGQSNVVYFTRP